jgi:hypothetical protein
MKCKVDQLDSTLTLSFPRTISLLALQENDLNISKNYCIMKMSLILATNNNLF